MKYVIGDDCVCCGTCAANCPQGAVTQGDVHYEIEQDKCVQCGTCYSNCPIGAITEED